MKGLRRRSDPGLSGLKESFTSVAVRIDAAQRALLAAVPKARDPGIPLAQALKEFTRRLGAAEAAMPAWRDDRVMHEWTNCWEALAAARSEAETLRLLPRVLEFEELNAKIGEVLQPLEAFADTERSFRRRW